MNESRKKFQELLRELFQFDCADLDFGIYRIMNQKRAEIERFIERDLLDAVAKELSKGPAAAQERAKAELAEVAGEVKQTLGADAISPEGELSDQYRATPLGQRYLEVREQARGYRVEGEQETVVFNHLYAFFGRYYQDGDFISKRRYSKRERYAIPYNGEEVYLHWANRDQYYVKTAEHFTDYSFKAPGDVTVHFKLQAADVEQNNVKGEKRFFLPLVAKAVWDDAVREVTVPFEYRPLTEQESITYGARDQQEKIITEALGKVPAKLKKHTEAIAALIAEKRRSSDDAPVTYLEHHLRQYTRRNTSDFFIHKNLRGFLERELDFYLKNEVLHLEELLAGDDGRSEGWFQLMQVIRRIGLHIITFLAQIEDFQKRLWEKKKFVLSTEYCMTLDRVPEAFYPEIARNKAQVEEWKRLFKIEETEPNLFHKGGKSKLDVAFLKAHPTLVLDTAFFGQDFKDRLLATFDGLDEQTGGLLVHGENLQALRLLEERYRGQLGCVYIDPPYNTNAAPILYKNGYQHASWLSLLGDRLQGAKQWLDDSAIVCVTIDDAELHHLRSLADTALPEYELLGAVAIKNNPAGRTAQVGFSVCHEYALFYGLPGAAQVGRLEHSEAQKARYKLRDERGAFEWTNFRKHGGLNTYRTARPRQFYPIYVTEDQEIRIPDMTWDDSARDWIVNEEPGPDEMVLWPVDEKGRERIWDFVVETARKNIPHFMVRKDSKGDIAIYRKWRINYEGLLPQTWWDKSLYSAAEYGTNLLTHIFGTAHEFTFPKSVHAVADCLRVCGLRNDGDALALDYFAGSGTTAHAVLNLNAEDGGDRRYILVEMADYFDTVLRPRVEKIMFSREWKEGKPTSNEGHSHMLRYQRLESYEDALNNIAFDAPGGQAAMEFSDYLLRYMLDFETRESETLLNVEKLESPFSYTLRIHRDGETQEQPVDLPETFNYLIGLHVTSRRAHADGDRRYLVYRGSNESSEVVVIWRDSKGWTQQDFERDQQFVLKQKLTEGAGEVFVNGDSLIPGAKSLDPVFKRQMLGDA